MVNNPFEPPGCEPQKPPTRKLTTALAGYIVKAVLSLMMLIVFSWVFSLALYVLVN